MNLASIQQGIKKLQWFEYLKVVFLEILNVELCRVFANQVTFKPPMTQLWPVTLNSPCFDVLLSKQPVSGFYKDPQAPKGQPFLGGSRDHTYAIYM